MTFTDEDLNRLKQHTGYFTDKKDQAYLPWPPNLDLEALVMRLEAAEKLIESSVEWPDSDDYKAWRRAKGENEPKAAGKDKAGGFIPDQTGEQPSKRIKYE